ncbi:hypothetical protein NC315_34180 [Streptomyces sp. G2]|uniref:hypothetical protein n=1 Tax=Streptomyces sp. G2 TaxID=1684471 RepID=UPI00202F87E6|nr:hypothetical protein [Streptomyces sp. G2]MCM1950381.1 hypothetical protein [Streptomyces sp. G2]
MPAVQWEATLTAAGVPEPTEEQYDHIHSTLEASTIYDTATGLYTLTWDLEASTLVKALNAAMAMAAKVLKEVELPFVAEGLTVRTVACAELEAVQAPRLALVGHKEIAEQLGVSRPRVGKLAETHPDFPRPAARLAAGPVYTQQSVDRFARAWDRSPGRRAVMGRVG